jgi:hypothetical protein
VRIVDVRSERLPKIAARRCGEQTSPRWCSETGTVPAAFVRALATACEIVKRVPALPHRRVARPARSTA